MKPTALVLLAGIALCLMAIIFLPQPGAPGQNSDSKDESPQITDLQIQDVVQGDGAEAQMGKTLGVNYTGWIYDPNISDKKGAKFDSSLGRAVFTLTLGSGQVIPGWERGLVGMKTGGKRILIIPPHLAYGSTSSGSIPANSTLLFEITLESVE